VLKNSFMSFLSSTVRRRTIRVACFRRYPSNPTSAPAPIFFVPAARRSAARRA
jgi:hypothetical protein